MLKRIALVLFICAGFLSCASSPLKSDGGSMLLPELLEFLSENPDSEAELLTRYVNEEISAYNCEQYVVIKRVLDTFSGGAHGMHSVDYRVFDRERAKLAVLGDIVRVEELPALKKAVDEAMRKKYSVPSSSGFTSAGFFDDEIELSDDFFVTDTGIGFQWDPYEIAPYAMGGVEIEVPYSALKTP
jgi:hypothetical protein